MKKIFVLLFVLIMMFFVTACGDEKETADGSSETSVNEITSDNRATDSQADVLTTEYDVEDYVDNAIIVSKNDGLLYGLIDNNGNEILPVKYDKMELFNKKDYIDGHRDIYIWCKYEDYEYLFDSKGKRVIQTKFNIEYVENLSKDDNSPIFKVVDKENGITKLYDKNADLIGSFDSKVNMKNVIISRNLYYHSVINVSPSREVTSESSCIRDYSGNILKDFGELFLIKDYIYDNKCILVFSESYVETSLLADVMVYHIDESGNVVKEETLEYSNVIDKYGTPPKKYNLYESNSTYKMEDLNGKPLYAERYYKKLDVDGKNDCYFLTDENDNVCIFGSQGYLYVKFGDFINKDGNLYLQSQDGDKKIEGVYEGKNSIAVIFGSSQGTQIKFYYSK